MSEDLRELSIGRHVSQSTPTVSIVIPNYNTAEFIAETLDSVFAQTFTDHEIIVINDASPDTVELNKALEPYYDRIIFIDKLNNSGTSATRNFASEQARADIIAFLDADDIWHPTFLEELLAFKSAGDYQMAYADAETFGAFQEFGSDLLSTNPEQGTITRQQLILGKCHILPSGTLIDAIPFRRSGGFDPGVKRTEDFDLWMHLAFDGVKIGYLKKILFRFRLRPGSGAGDSLQRIERCRDVWRILQQKLPFTAEENAQIEINVAHEEAALTRAQGRLAINERDWRTARKKFRTAYKMAGELGLPVKHRVKMLGIWLALNVYPQAVYSQMQKMRPSEIAHMPQNRSLP